MHQKFSTSTADSQSLPQPSKTRSTSSSETPCSVPICGYALSRVHQSHESRRLSTLESAFIQQQLTSRDILIPLAKKRSQSASANSLAEACSVQNSFLSFHASKNRTTRDVWDSSPTSMTHQSCGHGSSRLGNTTSTTRRSTFWRLLRLSSSWSALHLMIGLAALFPVFFLSPTSKDAED